MDWQEVAALSIVAITVAIFVYAKIRPRQKGFHCAGNCCSGGSRPKGSVVFRARKGERPQIIVKLQ